MVDALARARPMVRDLARAREAAGMTQAHVAGRIGTTQSAVARLERAEADPSLSTLVKYASVVGLRVSIVG
jgi:transcriptional regulator with XRE-family HTH domain